jgi:mono/diheme cytochrome c family protein
MTRSAVISLALAVLACSPGTRLPRASRGPEVLQVRGAVKGAPFRLGEADLAALRHARAQGIDPVAGVEAVFEGVDLARLEEEVVLAKGADTLVLRTTDRQAVPVPLSLVRQLHPVLAASADGKQLASRLVAWPNVEHHGLRTDPRAALWWARKVVALEYVAWASTYGRALRLPEGAPAGSLAGATTFVSRCMGCHRVREAGGGNGPDLTRAGESLTVEKMDSLLSGHPGPAAGPSPVPGDGTARQLLAFLRTIALTPPEATDEEAEPKRPQRPVPGTIP